MSTHRRLGILGGLGPDATAAFYTRLMRLAQVRGGARTIADYPEVFLHSLPLPIGPMWTTPPGVQLSSVLGAACQGLERSGADVIVAPCNSVHRWIAPMRAAVGVPVLSIVEETLAHAQAKGWRSLGLLSTAFTARERLYPAVGDRLGVEILLPERQARVDEIIVQIGAGRHGPAEIAALSEMIDVFAERGAQAVILGCTELPLVLSAAALPLLDTLDRLAEAAYTALQVGPP